MKLLLFLLALVAFACATDYRQEFMSFMRLNHKSYGKDEFDFRYKVFSENMERMSEMNSAHSLKHGTKVYGMTKFMDLSPEEFKALYLRKGIEMPKDAPEAKIVTNVNRPTSFDWRDKGAVNAVKNQGQCGSCWAFSTVSNVESMWFIAKGTLPNLSEQNLVDCDNLDSGCNGGLPSNAYKYVMANGLDTESCYPYKAYDQSCKFDKSCAECQISSWTSVSTDEGAIADWVYKTGPVSVALNAGFMQYYTGGVADPSDCDPSGIDHAVNIVGYGHDGKDFWLIRNSWGASWGESGYCRLVRGKGACGINRVVTTCVV